MSTETPLVQKNTVACLQCRQLKVKCDVVGEFNPVIKTVSYATCSRCRKLCLECEIQTSSRRRGGAKRFIATDTAMVTTKILSDVPFGSDTTISPDANSGVYLHPSRAFLADSTLPSLSRDSSPPLADRELPNPLRILAGVSSQTQLQPQSSAGVNSSSSALMACLLQASPPTITGQHEPLLLQQSDSTGTLKVARSVLQQGLNALSSEGSDTPSSTVNAYFDAANSRSKRRDVDPGLCPINLGLLDSRMATQLFDHFYSDIHPYAPVLDPLLATIAYTRSRSALLLTAILLVSAQTLEGQASLTECLHRHSSSLLKHIFDHNLSSLEIIQGLNVLAVWPRAANRVEEDQQSRWLTHAIAMMLDMRLDSVLTHPQRGHAADTVIQPLRRLARSKERTLIALFIWDRSFALATGRTWLLGDASVTPAMSSWEKDDLANPGDAHLIDVLWLRLICSGIRTTALSATHAPVHQQHVDDTLPRTILKAVAGEIDCWMPRLSVLEIAGSPDSFKQAICINVILAQTRLWTLALGISPNPISEIQILLRKQCWNAAIKSCELVVLHASTLRHLSASIALMTTYGALMALSLYQHFSEDIGRTALIGLLAQVACFLVDSASKPAHRNGPNAMYGKQLLKLLKITANSAVNDEAPPTAGSVLHPVPQLVPSWSETLGMADIFGADFFNLPPAAATLAGLGYGNSFNEDEFHFLNWPSTST